MNIKLAKEIAEIVLKNKLSLPTERQLAFIILDLIKELKGSHKEYSQNLKGGKK